MITKLKVNGQERPILKSEDDLIFSWESGEERQFTVQMASDKYYIETRMYLDTQNHYCIYRGFPLESGRKYYWRVRSGINEWESGEFTIGEGL